MIRELHPDLVITDVNMPLMDGLQMIEQCYEERLNDVKFAIMSGYNEFEYARKALRFGIEHYMLKPIMQEEAEEVLEKIHADLQQAQKQRRLALEAEREETASLIRNVLLDIPIDEAGRAKLRAMSNHDTRWNVLMIQSEALLLMNVRRRMEQFLAQEVCTYVVDLGQGRLGAVYREAQDDSELEFAKLLALSREYSSLPVLMALGKSQASLLDLAHGYRTARTAMQLMFYDADYTHLVSYENFRTRPFQHHYPTYLLDNMIRTAELLDKSGFREAVTAASSTFREMLVDPQIVKKMMVHVFYSLLGMVEELDEQQSRRMMEKYEIPGVNDHVVSLGAMMTDLIAAGEECIDLLLVQQMNRSQGVVQDINAYIQAHYRENLTIKRLAELFFIHPVYLGQLFLRKNGISVNEFVHNLRIEEAVLLLAQNKLKNGEIAERVGYSNYNQFLKHFEKRMEMSPNEYKSRRI